MLEGKINAVVRRFLIAIAFTVAVKSPSVASEAADKIISDARSSCEELAQSSADTQGTFEFDSTLISHIDLTGDGKAEEIIDSGDFQCSVGGLYCGSGGCNISIIAEGKITEFLAKNWTVKTWNGHPILLLAVHGMECGGAGVVGCLRAVVWSHGDFQSVRKFQGN